MGPTRTSLHATPRAFPAERTSWARRVRRAKAALVVSCALSATSGYAQKTDVIILDNGDHITGDIKGMAQGKVDFNTDDAGRPSIKWDKIARITSTHVFEVELSSGKKYYGTLTSPADREVMVGTNPADTVPFLDVVALTPMDDYFWARVKADFDLGFTLTKASSSMTLSSDGQFAYRGQHFGGALAFNTYWQRFSDATHVGQFSGTLTGTYYFTKWRAELQFGVDHNDELQLKLRLELAGGFAYPILRNNWNEFWLSFGLIGAYEQYTTVEPQGNVAVYGGAGWEAFIYDTPKLTAGTSFQLVPVLNELWRTRGNLKVQIKYEVFKDFFVGTNFTFTFDTAPPDPTAAHTDYLLALTIGWSYRQ